ncbi:MAG: DNA-binding protein [Chloroflexota bacterium]|nr:DNA-binding protein [Chloroflexota bacterium]
MRIESGTIKRLHVVHLNPGDDVLQSLRAAVQYKNIQHGIILGAIGSVTRYHFHVVASPDLPPAELFPKGEGAYDIATMTGFILNGRVHCHIIFSDHKIAFGGHLEEGCTVLTFNVVPIAEVEDMDLTDFDTLQPLN